MVDPSKPLQHIDQRLNLTTATNPNARWLFPGRRSGQPMTPNTLENRLRQHQIPGLRGRTAAIRQLVLQAPARAGARFSITVPITHGVRTAIAAITDDAWTAIRYPQAVGDEQGQCWISDAHVAEITFRRQPV